MTLRFLPSSADKSSSKSHDSLDELIHEACPDIFWTISEVDKDKLMIDKYKLN